MRPTTIVYSFAFTAVFLFTPIRGAEQLPIKNDTKCEGLLNDIDFMVKTILHMRSDPIFPKNETLLEEYCRPHRDLIPTVIKAAPCLPPFLAQVMLVFAYGLRRVLKTACGGRDRALLKYYQCIDETFIKELQRIEGIYLNSLYRIKDNATEDETIPILCCSTRKTLESVKNMTSPQCSNRALDLTDYLYSRLTKGLSEFLSLICSTFPDFQTCIIKSPSSVEFLTLNESPEVNFENQTLVQTFLSVINRLTV